LAPAPRRRLRRSAALALLGLAGALLGACTPKAQVEVVPPEEPIVINLNVKIEHEIRVKVEKDLEEAFAEEEKIF
jgi:hypothetical protein